MWGYWISSTASAPLMALSSSHIFSTALFWNEWWATAKGLAQLEKCRFTTVEKTLLGCHTCHRDLKRWRLRRGISHLLWRSLMVLYVWFSSSFLSSQLSHSLSAVQLAAEGTEHDCWKSGDSSVFFKDDATSLPGYPSCSYAYKISAISEVLTTNHIIKIPDICIKH